MPSNLVVNGYSRTSSRPAATEGNLVPVRAWRDGSISTAEFLNILAGEGRVFVANFGTVATQLTFLAQAANRPDFWVRVPSGTTILPIYCTIALGASAGTVTTKSLRIAQNDIGNGTSSAASIGPISTRTDAPIGVGLCTPRQLATADTTAETSPAEIWKHVTITASAAGNDGLSEVTVHRDEMGYPVIVGPGTWEGFIWASSTQATGYGIMCYAEIPTADYFS